MSFTPSLYAVTARWRAPPFGTGSGSFSTAPVPVADTPRPIANRAPPTTRARLMATAAGRRPTGRARAAPALSRGAGCRRAGLLDHAFGEGRRLLRVARALGRLHGTRKC